LTEYLIGTGGWSYLNIPGRPPLKTYSEHFNFVEVNYTFYKYPSIRMVERWRQTVPEDFTFTVRCHRDLTHTIGLRPVEQAYTSFTQMMVVCKILNAPILHLLTPERYRLDDSRVSEVRDFLSSIDLKDIQLAWEFRGSPTRRLRNLLQDFDIVHSVDISREKTRPILESDVVYTRLFGRGRHTIYQFSDEELKSIDETITELNVKKAAVAFHGQRMNTDALRFKHYREEGVYLPVTAYTGIDSAKSVLQEDAMFPATREELIEHQGWKLIDLKADKRIRLSELLSNLPDETFYSVDEVLGGLRIHFDA
jgi:uncharacterized protein YecE (DUF72 family)